MGTNKVLELLNQKKTLKQHPPFEVNINKIHTAMKILLIFVEGYGHTLHVSLVYRGTAFGYPGNFLEMSTPSHGFSLDILWQFLFPLKFKAW